MATAQAVTTEAILRYRSEGLDQALTGAERMGEASTILADRTERLSRAERDADNALKAVFRSYDAGFRSTERAITAQDRLNRALAQGLIDSRNHERMSAQVSATTAREVEVARMRAAANDNLTGSLGHSTGALQAQLNPLSDLRSSYAGLTSLVAGLGAAYAAREFVQTVTTFQAIEASLKAATGSTEGAQAGMAFVRAETDRLGLSLGSTAKDFTSFAAATRGTELQGEKTRQIFSAVAEAGTVLGLSADTMGGALNALTQMASKGTVQSEELRGQLGERLPGAFNIAAKAMGVTTAELGKMLESGQVVASDFLPKFADELHRTFGPEAVKASDNLRANINRLGTSITDLYLAAGQGGLTAALNDATKQATAFLKSNQDVAASVGGSLATGLRTGGQAFEFLRRNSELAGTALAAIVALRYGPTLAGIAVDTARAAAMMGVYSVETRGLVVSQTAAVASSRALSVAMGALGGPVGIALTAAAAAVAYLALHQDEATKAAEAQTAGLKQLDAALGQSKSSLAGAADDTKRLAAEQIKAAESAVQVAQARLISAEALAQAGQSRVSFGPEDQMLGGSAQAGLEQDAIQRADDLSTAKERLAATMRLVAGAASDADRAMLGLPPTIGAVSAAVEASIPRLQSYGDALAKLVGMVPQLQAAVDATNKMGAAKVAFEKGQFNADQAYWKGEIGETERNKLQGDLSETYRRATQTVSGYTEAQEKLEARTRAATIGAMKPQQGEIARLRDAHETYVRSLSEGEKATLSTTQRNELAAKSEKTLATEIANVNTKYAEKAAKAAASGGSGTDAYDNALQRSRDQVQEFQAIGEAAGKTSEEVLRLAEANRLRRAAASAGRADDAGITDEIERQAGAYARARTESDRALEAQRRMQDSTRELGQEFGNFVEDLLLGSGKIGDAFGSLAKSFAGNSLRALLTGEGGLAGAYGTAPTEKGGLGGILGSVTSGKLDFGSLFDPDKWSRAISQGTASGTKTGVIDAAKASQSLGGSGGLFMPALAGGSIGFSSGNPLTGALGGALAGLASGNPLMAVAGPMCGFGGKIGQRRKANDNPKPSEEKPADDRHQRPLAA